MVERVRHVERHRVIRRLAAAILWMSPGCPVLWPDASAVTRSDTILYQSRDLMIYRALDRNGAPVVVLTNLDEDGNALAGPDASALPDSTPPRGGAETCQPAPTPSQSAAGSRSGAGEVHVVVNQAGGQPVDAGEVEVSSEGGGGTTVVINVNPPPPPERETVVVPGGSLYPVLSYGGIVGPFRYPDHLYFLGYGPDNSSPSRFGGLGLNAGNGFGVRSVSSGRRGPDCMFGPSRRSR